jgi:hypothetical protein
LREQKLADALLRLLQALLACGGDARDLEHVEPALRLHRAGQLVLLGTKDRRVERLILLALRHAEQLAFLLLGSGVVGQVLHHVLEALAAFEAAQGLVRLVLVLGPDDLEVASLGLGELLLVRLEVVLDLVVTDLPDVARELLAKLVREHVEADAEQDVVLRLPRRLEEALVGPLRLEGLVPRLLELAVDLLVVRADVAVRGLALDPAGGDQELDDLVPELVVGRRSRLRGLRRLLAILGGCLLARVHDPQPVVEVSLRDRLAVDVGDGPPRHLVVATAGREADRQQHGQRDHAES